EEAAQRQTRTPEPAVDGPTGARQGLRRPAAAHLHDRDVVALLDQPVRGDAAAKTGPDDDEVEIPVIALTRHGGALCSRDHNGTAMGESIAQYLAGWSARVGGVRAVSKVPRSRG